MKFMYMVTFKDDKLYLYLVHFQTLTAIFAFYFTGTFR